AAVSGDVVYLHCYCALFFFFVRRSPLFVQFEQFCYLQKSHFSLCRVRGFSLASRGRNFFFLFYFLLSVFLFLFYFLFYFLFSFSAFYSVSFVMRIDARNFLESFVVAFYHPLRCHGIL